MCNILQDKRKEQTLRHHESSLQMQPVFIRYLQLCASTSMVRFCHQKPAYNCVPVQQMLEVKWREEKSVMMATKLNQCSAWHRKYRHTD